MSVESHIDVQLSSSMDNWPRNLLGRLEIVRAGMTETAEAFVRHALESRNTNGRPFYSTSANGQVLALCQQDSAFRELMIQADQIHADGMSIVIYSRLTSITPLPERIATTDLVHSVAELAAETGVSFYFLGGSEEVNANAVENMSRAYPKLVFAGRRNGYFSRSEEESIIADINAAAPDILWVGLGVPLEQEFVARNIDKITTVGLIKTSGGLFDFLANKNSRAPKWMQINGLEWLYRMLREPRRLAKRYITTSPIAIHALIRHSQRPRPQISERTMTAASLRLARIDGEQSELR